MSQFFTSGGQSIGALMDMSLNKLQELVMDRNFSFHHCSHCLQWFWSPRKSSLSLFPLFPHLIAIKWLDWMPWSWFLKCWVLSQLYTFILKSIITLSGKLDWWIEPEVQLWCPYGQAFLLGSLATESTPNLPILWKMCLSEEKNQRRVAAIIKTISHW